MMTHILLDYSDTFSSLSRRALAVLGPWSTCHCWGCWWLSSVSRSPWAGGCPPTLTWSLPGLGRVRKVSGHLVQVPYPWDRVQILKCAEDPWGGLRQNFPGNSTFFGGPVLWGSQSKWKDSTLLTSAHPPPPCVFSENKMGFFKLIKCSVVLLFSVWWISLFNPAFPSDLFQRQKVSWIWFEVILWLWVDSFLALHILDEWLFLHTQNGCCKKAACVGFTLNIGN